VEAIYLNRVFEKRMAPNDPKYTQFQQRKYIKMELEPGWEENQSVDGNKVIIAVFDEGYIEHPDLKVHKIKNFLFQSGTGAAHALAVLGICCSSTNNGIGIAGITWNGTYWLYMVGDQTSLLSALTDLKDFHDANPSYKFVINFSQGYFASDPGLWTYLFMPDIKALDALLVTSIYRTPDQNGINLDSYSQLDIPACFENYTYEGESEPRYGDYVISCAMVRDDDARDMNCSYGNSVTLCGPGYLLQTLDPSGNYIPETGTSLTTPIIAAMAAMTWDKNPGFTAPLVKQKIAQMCDKIGGDEIYTINAKYGKKSVYYGYGRINWSNGVGVASIADKKH